MQQVTTLSPAERFALIIESLCKLVAARSDPRRYGVNLGGLTGQLLVLICTRLHRMKARFAARAARHAATPFPIPCRPAAPRTFRQRQPDPLPRHRAWLLQLIQGTACGISHLRLFLDDPEVAALLAEAPKLRRILRPLCHALNISIAQIPCLQEPPPAPDAAPAPPPDAPPQAAPVTNPPAAVPPLTTPSSSPIALKPVLV